MMQYVFYLLYGHIFTKKTPAGSNANSRRCNRRKGVDDVFTTPMGSNVTLIVSLYDGHI